MTKNDRVYCLNISSGHPVVPFAKGTILWIAFWWPWAKVSVHEVGIMWLRKYKLLQRYKLEERP